MTHKRNIKGLEQAAKKRRLEAIARVNIAINKLRRENLAVNFNTVSNEANVGKPFLYKEPEIRQQIEALRQQAIAINRKNDSVPLQTLQTASDKSKDNIITMLKQTLRDTELENKKLKNQIEILYGQLVSK